MPRTQSGSSRQRIAFKLEFQHPVFYVLEKSTDHRPDPWTMIRRILVPIDFSAQSLEAAKIAGALAKQLDARMRFLTVLDVSDLRAALKAQLHGFRSDAEVHRALLRWIRGQFAQVRVPPGVPFTHAIKRGIADAEILHAIYTYRPQIVVMGSRGLAHRIPVGSNTASVLRNSPVPVLVCPLGSGL